MKVRMLRNRMGSNDGTTTKLYEEGEVYEVSEDLGAIFLREKDAEASDDKAEKAEAKAPANKAEAKAPENKAIGAAPENKAS